MAASALIDFIVVRYTRFFGCYVFISALELFNFFFLSLVFLIIDFELYVFTFNPRRLGNMCPFFPLGFLVFISGGIHRFLA